MIKNSKNSKIFICEKCDFKCYKHNEFLRHLSTAKHNKICNDIKKTPKDEFICSCGKEYKHSSGLWRHKQGCKPNDILMAELLKQNNDLLLQNQELKELITEQKEIILEQKEVFIEQIEYNKQLLGIEVSIPFVSNEQESFIKLFYPHDPEIKLSNKEVETALARFNSDDARLIAHYSGLLLKRESINNPDNYHSTADDWLAKVMQAKDPVDTNRIVSVWLREYDFTLDHKKLKNFKLFFENNAKYVVDVGGGNVFPREELEKYHSERFKRRCNIIPVPFNKNISKTKSIKNLIDYRYCSDGKGAYYIWKHEIPKYSKLWTWIKNWF